MVDPCGFLPKAGRFHVFSLKTQAGEAHMKARHSPWCDGATVRCSETQIELKIVLPNNSCVYILPETNSQHLKNDAWNMIVSFWDGLVSGANC